MAVFSDLATDISLYYLHRVDVFDYLYHFLKSAQRTICAKVPFEELQSSDLITCTIDDPVINLPVTTTDLQGVMWMRIRYGDGSVMRLKKTHKRNFDAMPVPASRRPVQYARWGLTVELWPPPDQAYEIDLRYWRKPIDNVTPANTQVVVPSHWEELLNWEAVYRYWTAVGKTQEAQALVVGSMQPKMPSPKKTAMLDMGIIPRLWNELLTVYRERETWDDDDTVNPVRPNNG